MKALFFVLIVVAAGVTGCNKTPSCVGNATQCAPQRADITQPLPALMRKDVPGSFRTTIPCQFVGEWTVKRGETNYIIDLKGDGLAGVAPNTATGMRPGAGRWAVQGDTFIWDFKPASNVMDLDFNKIQKQPADDQFLLVDKRGGFIYFEFSKPFIPDTCTK
jgi:hypothetical protein